MIQLTNGKIEISSDEKTEYAFELQAQHGSVDEFQSSKNPIAFKIKAIVVNGKIENSN